MTTQAQIEAARNIAIRILLNENTAIVSANREHLINRFTQEIAALTAAAQVGEQPVTVEHRYHSNDSINKRMIAAAQANEPHPSDYITDTFKPWEHVHLQQLINNHIERCAQWLTDEAKAIRAGVSGGNGSERGWIEADALDRAAAAMRKLKDEP